MTLVLDSIVQGYGSSVIIDGLSVTLEPGIVGLLGPNGAGKTTLLRTMATVLPPRSGTWALDDRKADSERAARSVRSDIGYLPQQFGYDPSMKVIDFVRYAAWLRGIPSKQWDAVAREAIEHVDLGKQSATAMRRLSGGQRQRAGIAWAIVGRPRLVLLDEPTVGLDPRQRLQFRKIIADLSDSIVVLSTHLIDDIGAICDRVIVFHSGSTAFTGTVDELAAAARPDLPGASDLERGYMAVLPEEEQYV